MVQRGAQGQVGAARRAARRGGGAGRRELLGGVLGAVLALGTLTACTPEGPDPQITADALADALTTGTFDEVTLTGATAAEAAAQRTAAFEGLAPWRPTVTAAKAEVVEDEPEKATARLRFTWDVDASDTDWTYETTARLTRVEDAWEAAWTSYLLAPDLVPSETLTVRRTAAARADVLGAGGEPIVTSRDVVRIGIDKTRVAPDQQQAAAGLLVEALELEASSFGTQVASAGEKAFVQAIVVRTGDPAYDVEALTAIPGVRAVPDTLPLAPTRRFARPLLGTVGDATAEIVEESQGAVAAGDVAGLSGLQRQYDAQLRGLPGLSVLAVAPEGAAQRELFRSEPVAGQPLVTTLDVRLQDAAETILEPIEVPAAIVALRPSTGDVLVAASGPGSAGLSTATVGKYPPGSTLKVATSLALLRAGLTPDSTLSCPPTVTVEGREFRNYPGYPASAIGDIPLRTALANSCNTAFIGARDQVPQEALASAAASLGLGASADVGFPAFLGSVPAESEGTDHAASMIGQGRTEASPLAMARLAASVAVGSLVTPRLVLPPEGGAVPADAGAEDAGAAAPSEAAAGSTATPVPLTAAEADALRGLMRAFVTEGGGDFLQDAPGPEVLAKSGTAQFGPADALQNHAWMIAVQGDLAVAVFVEVGDYGSTTSGPLLEAFLAAVNGG
ncbi:penicillin-binding transpeptidase domain-containing protein [Cellulomonas cellasea]|uniref:Cell division protein FtsI/penicillin-binding protein 2 n=1 Tax=Cellulomonas cellasea TaxID=43670 RepID=A0A7W4UG41_9CELL|nr:penicillin-binding transpeptidase domain-containing protein [Cellulomonas cellasea]MBB2923507.1 cell division protein FtsI/penicillin-binding protein 2 [Cellulomonas cellasea]